MQTRRLFLLTSLAIAALETLPGAAAQTYPSRPISVVVPFAAGGPTDTLARIMADRMRISLGQTVVVENVTGGAGSIAVGRVARAAPDGHTLSIGNWGTHVINGAALRLQYNLLNDFEPVALLADNPLLIEARTRYRRLTSTD
jgi:tripartite-type tricarboxylate transporter receptor subunit TctC